jgi:hypothetical protein
MMTSCGVRRLRGRRCRWSAAVAKTSACWLDCRFSRASNIHSRMMVRRTFDLGIPSPLGERGSIPRLEATTRLFEPDWFGSAARKLRNPNHEQCPAR